MSLVIFYNNSDDMKYALVKDFSQEISMTFDKFQVIKKGV